MPPVDRMAVDLMARDAMTRQLDDGSGGATAGCQTDMVGEGVARGGAVTVAAVFSAPLRPAGEKTRGAA